MADILDNQINLKILKNICDGKAVSINYSSLSKKLGKHRDTIRKRVKEILKKEIINLPISPFFGQFREHPLLILVQADIALNKDSEEWIKEDHHIFAAYKIKRGEHNMLLMLFHRSILRYQLWRLSLTREKKIPSRSIRYPSSASFFSTQMMIKYEPSASIKILEDILEKKGSLNLNNYKFDKLSLQILKYLTKGEGIQINETLLSKILNINRKTIKLRIKKLLEENIILKPACRFPTFFGPSESILVISLVEVKKNKKEFVKHIKEDPHISFAFQVCSGRYNYLLFEVFERVADHIKWEHDLNKTFRYLGCCDAIYVTPNMTINLDQQKVSLAVINKKLSLLEKPEPDVKWNPFLKDI